MVNGKIIIGDQQYVNAGGDYNYGINTNSSDENKTAALIFVKWMVERSNWCYNEGGYTVVKGGKNPDMYAAFNGCEVASDQPAKAGEETYLKDFAQDVLKALYAVVGLSYIKCDFICIHGVEEGFY